MALDLDFLEKFSQKIGFEIARILLEEYDSVDFERDSQEIEREIDEVSLSYSRIMFFEAKEFLQESVRGDVRSHLSSRFDNKRIQKMKDIDLVAHWIKSKVVRKLEDESIFL